MKPEKPKPKTAWHEGVEYKTGVCLTCGATPKSAPGYMLDDALWCANCGHPPEPPRQDWQPPMDPGGVLARLMRAFKGQ